jgi:hypothetical protein
MFRNSTRHLTQEQRQIRAAGIRAQIRSLEGQLLDLQETCGPHRWVKRGNLVECSICDKSELFSPITHKDYIFKTIAIPALKIVRPSKTTCA